MYLHLEEPESSSSANMLWLFMGIMILVSVFTMVLEPFLSSMDVTESDHTLWKLLEAVFTAVFTIEYLLRLSVANAMGTQTTLAWATTPSNICDLCAVMPLYIELLLRLIIGVDDDGSSSWRLLRIVRLLRLTRISRIARLTKKHPLFGPVAMVLMVIWFIYLKTAKEH